MDSDSKSTENRRRNWVDFEAKSTEIQPKILLVKFRLKIEIQLRSNWNHWKFITHKWSIQIRPEIYITYNEIDVKSTEIRLRVDRNASVEIESIQKLTAEIPLTQFRAVKSTQNRRQNFVEMKSPEVHEWLTQWIRPKIDVEIVSISKPKRDRNIRLGVWQYFIFRRNAHRLKFDRDLFHRNISIVRDQ